MPDFKEEKKNRAVQKSPENTGEFAEGKTPEISRKHSSFSAFHYRQKLFSEIEKKAPPSPSSEQSSQTEFIPPSRDQLPSRAEDYSAEEETVQEQPAAEEVVDVKCPHCGVICEAPVHALNRESRCPACGNKFKVIKHDELSEKSVQQTRQSFFARLMDEITRGRYSRYRRLEYRAPLKQMHRMASEMNRENNDIRKQLQSCREERERILQNYRRRRTEEELRGRSVQELLNLTGVGEATVEKLQFKGIENLYDLYNSLETILNSYPRLPFRAGEAIKNHVLSTVSSVKAENPPINPSVPEVRRLLELELKEDWLTARLPDFEEKGKSVKKKAESFSPLSFVRFLLFPKFYEETELKIKKELSEARKLHNEHEKQRKKGLFKFDELTQDQYLRAIGLLQKRLKTSSDAPVTGEETKRVGLPFDSDLVAKIENFKLDTSSIRNCILRRYQEFAASFAMVQGHVLLGDEMGLGKTIEALAVISHLAAHKDRIFVLA